MFEDDEAAPSFQRKRSEKAAPFNWKSLPVDVLIKYRDEITQCLPALTLSEVNLEEELLLQFQTLRVLQTEVLNDETIPLNQRAQVANAVGNTLDRLIGAQSEVYDQERFKSIENVLIRHLRKLPEAFAEDFLKDYERVLSGGK